MIIFTSLTNDSNFSIYGDVKISNDNGSLNSGSLKTTDLNLVKAFRGNIID